MSEIRGSIWRPIAALTVLGAVCGLVALGVFQWWWNSLASPHILTGGSYREPFSDPTFTGPDFIDLFPAEPAPWLYSGLVLGPTAVGLLAGIVFVVFARRNRAQDRAITPDDRSER
ncbi:hypothetical protein ACHMZP_04460 [Rhodococcus baikonurensis]|jgi:hypothetical protein|uniref:hypothetical protein n=1 Tax=Rhodococcus erythropolis group TaxID=2840174 RepID=UPI000BB3552A|nr:hypothetical protein [Rhodococcus erythropolis]PBI98028.1 hypothetical protein BKP42_24680 [Rhodococcus erythropolis]